MTNQEQSLRERIADITRDRFKFPHEDAGLTWDESFNYMLAKDILDEFLAEIDKAEVMQDIPIWLPTDKYWRECADEDGAIQKYKLRVDTPSFIEGVRAQLDAIKRRLTDG